MSLSKEGLKELLIFSKTFLNKNKEVEVSETEWEYLKDSFLIKLEKSSANIYPYRIFEK